MMRPFVPSMYSHISPQNLQIRIRYKIYFILTTSASEMVSEVYYPELHQELINLLAAWVLGLGVGVEVT